METVFVGESLMDSSENNRLQKLKIGEIFQLGDSSLSMSCLNCSQEFQYFTEFSLHIQDHFWHGEITQSKEIKEEISNDIDDEILVSPEVKCEVIQNDFDDFFDDGFQEHGFEETVSATFLDQYIEGTDYEKSNDNLKCLTCDYFASNTKELMDHLPTHSGPKEFLCPICSKLFATISYVQKHCSRTHNQKISLQKIKEAQPTTNNPKIEIIVNPTSPPAFPVPPVTSALERKQYHDGTDYRKVGDKFECTVCNRKMAKLDHLKEHLLTHSSEKNVLCPFCARAFMTESYVRKHVNRTHNLRITAEEIKAAQPSINISQTKKEWAIEKNQKITQEIKVVSEEGTVCCMFCDKKFAKARYAQKHMRLIHAKSIAIGDIVARQPVANQSDVKIVNDDVDATKERVKNFECFECHKKFVSANSVRIHQKLHSGIKFFCPQCDKVFAMKSYVRDHMVIMHNVKREEIPKDSIRQTTDIFPENGPAVADNYECYLCRNQYRKRNRLREHMQAHISGPFLCVFCGTIYKSNDTLRHHMEKHKSDKAHQCLDPDCGKVYPTRRYMLSHYRTIHLNKRRKKTVSVEKKYDFVCEICNKSFLSEHNLRAHKNVHNRDTSHHICHICGWHFKERSNLKQHLESHGNNKTSCGICNKQLSHRYMQEHMKIHEGQKEFQCSTCGHQFVSRERLKRHMVRHSGEPKYKCDLCPKAYTRSDKLLYHRRSHEEQMSYVCSVKSCGKGFFSIKSLRKHENKHYLEDNKPNKCI